MQNIVQLVKISLIGTYALQRVVALWGEIGVQNGFADHISNLHCHLQVSRLELWEASAQPLSGLINLQSDVWYFRKVW